MSTSATVLSLFRSFIREARQMPTRNRRDFIVRKVRSELQEHKQLSDMEQLKFQVDLMELQLDNVRHQRRHLLELAEQGNLKGPR